MLQLSRKFEGPEILSCSQANKNVCWSFMNAFRKIQDSWIIDNGHNSSQSSKKHTLHVCNVPSSPWEPGVPSSLCVVRLGLELETIYTISCFVCVPKLVTLFWDIVDPLRGEILWSSKVTEWPWKEISGLWFSLTLWLLVSSMMWTNSSICCDMIYSTRPSPVWWTETRSQINVSYFIFLLLNNSSHSNTKLINTSGFRSR